MLAFCLYLPLRHHSFNVLLNTTIQQGSIFLNNLIFCLKGKGGFSFFPQLSTSLATNVFFFFWELSQIGDFFSENEKARLF
jgi:hypothetical protein